ncbi:hypothetical protein V8E53_007154 [Lactarius tabidus]
MFEPRLLLPALFAVTDASSAHEKVRIVTASSSANYLTTGINLDATMPLWMNQSTVNGSCQGSCTTSVHSLTSLWHASWRGGTATILCPRHCGKHSH